MKSPFPGMDPYFEVCRLWEGFHHHLIEGIYRTLAKALSRGYTADTAVRRYVVLMETEGKKERLAKPDVTVTRPKPAKPPRKRRNGAATAVLADEAESVRMQAFVAERFEEAFVEIYAEGEERFLVTCIEVLSPSNKRGAPRAGRSTSASARPCCWARLTSSRSICSAAGKGCP